MKTLTTALAVLLLTSAFAYGASKKSQEQDQTGYSKS